MAKRSTIEVQFNKQGSGFPYYAIVNSSDLYDPFGYQDRQHIAPLRKLLKAGPTGRRTLTVSLDRIAGGKKIKVIAADNDGIFGGNLFLGLGKHRFQVCMNRTRVYLGRKPKVGDFIWFKSVKNVKPKA